MISRKIIRVSVKGSKFDELHPLRPDLPTIRGVNWAVLAYEPNEINPTSAVVELWASDNAILVDEDKGDMVKINKLIQNAGEKVIDDNIPDHPKKPVKIGSIIDTIHNKTVDEG